MMPMMVPRMAGPMATAPPVTQTIAAPQIATAMPQGVYPYPYAPPYATTSGSYAPPMVMPQVVTSGSYVPPAVASTAPNTMVTTAPAQNRLVTTTTRNVQATPPATPASSATAAAPPAAMYGTMPVGVTTQFVSGSYVPPVVSGSLSAPVAATAYSAPQMTVVSGSYVPPAVSGSYTAAAPMMALSGSYAAAPMVPMYGAPPMVLPGAAATSGSYSAAPPKETPNPDQVSAQKTAYKNALDKQFQQALAQIELERDSKKQLIRQSAQQEKDQFSLRARSALEAKKLELDTALNGQLIMLQETAMNHKKVLEEKAAALTLDFQTRKANEDLLFKQYQIQKQFVDNERQLNQEFQQKQQRLSASTKSLQQAQ